MPQHSDRNIIKRTSDDKTIKPRKRDKKTSFSSLNDLFGEFSIKKNKGFISQEFQDFGYRLAVELDDLEHKSLYIRMAKRENRGLLERAKSFVSDAQAKNKGALFMWKVKQLKGQLKQ